MVEEKSLVVLVYTSHLKEGRLLVQALDEVGAYVAIASPDSVGLDEVALDPPKESMLLMHCDISNPKHIQVAFDTASAKFGVIDSAVYLVNVSARDDNDWEEAYEPHKNALAQLAESLQYSKNETTLIAIARTAGDATKKNVEVATNAWQQTLEDIEIGNHRCSFLNAEKGSMSSGDIPNELITALSEANNITDIVCALFTSETLA